MYLLNILKNPTLLRGCRFIAQWDRHHSRLSRYSGKSLFIHSCIQFEQKYAQRACLTLKSILYQTTSSNHVKGVCHKKNKSLYLNYLHFHTLVNKMLRRIPPFSQVQSIPLLTKKKKSVNLFLHYPLKIAGHESNGYHIKVSNTGNGCKEARFPFHLVTPERTFCLAATTHEDRAGWLSVIQQTLKRPLTPQDSTSKYYNRYWCNVFVCDLIFELWKSFVFFLVLFNGKEFVDCISIKLIINNFNYNIIAWLQ